MTIRSCGENSGYCGADVVSAVEETYSYPTIHLMGGLNNIYQPCYSKPPSQSKNEAAREVIEGGNVRCLEQCFL